MIIRIAYLLLGLDAGPK